MDIKEVEGGLPVLGEGRTLLVLPWDMNYWVKSVSSVQANEVV